MLSVVINPQCPWYDMYEKFGAPNVHWCEEILCSYINNPANTWTNIGYILFGLIAYKLGSNDSRFTKLYSFALVFTGLTSGFYHATNNYLTQFFDFVGMFTLVVSIIAINFKRLNLTDKLSLKFFGTATAILSAGFFYAHYLFPVQMLITICVVVIISQEIFLYFKKPKPRDFYIFSISMFLLACAQACSLIDLKRIWCEPTNHILLQGHALWHLIASVALFVYFLYVRKNIRK